MGFPGDAVVKNPPANAGDADLIPGFLGVILKEISPEYSFERLILKLKLQHFGHLM